MRLQVADVSGLTGARLVGRIPVRNIWLLFLYASNLARLFGRHSAAVEASPDFPSLIARLLCYAVERRLRRNLSRGYQAACAVLPRLRGRIDVLNTYAGNLLSMGMIACRFADFTFDTPRNRLVRAALDVVANCVGDRLLQHECRRLAADLGRQGVGGMKPSRAQLSADRMGRADADDLLMVTLAHLVFDLLLPMEDYGDHAMTRVEKDIVLVRQLFEKAVGNFYASELPELGWKVYQGKKLNWQLEGATPGIRALLPGMTSDIILENVALGRRVVVDTKFTNVFGTSPHRLITLKSGYIYQLYAYLRSQEKIDDPLSMSSSGIFLHPTVDTHLHEAVRIQGHEICFMTIDLTLPATKIIQQLRATILDATSQ